MPRRRPANGRWLLIIQALKALQSLPPGFRVRGIVCVVYSVVRLSPVLTLAGAALLVLACSERPRLGPTVEIRSPIEIDQQGKVFQLATARLAERSPAARLREAAGLGTGALLVPFLDAAGTPLLAGNGTRIRGTCGATFIAPSYAVTAAHCVDGTKADLQALVMEMYRPTAAIDPGYRRAASLAGSFPNFTHPALGAGEGYFVDRYDCQLISRCAGLYGGPVNCDAEHSRPTGESDTALVRCDGTPGLKYGFAEIAATDDATAEAFLAWKHEIYDIPSQPAPGATDATTSDATGSSTDDRWLHYVTAPARPADNLHYFGKDSAGVEQNHLLPLISADHADGTPHRKLGATAFSVSTDLLGCQGTSGAGVLQQSAGEPGLWQLLGPTSGGNLELESYLCNHIPSLDGLSRAPGTLGISYMALEATRYVHAVNQRDIETDCDPIVAGATTLFTHLECLRAGLRATPANAAFAGALGAARVTSDLDRLRGPVALLKAGQTIDLAIFTARVGAHYRIGLSAWSSAGCQIQPCPRLAIAVDGREVLDHVFETAPAKPLPLGATFRADQTGTVTVTFAVTGGDQFELGGITLLPDGAVNTFDTMPERLGAHLVDLATAGGRPQAMRFVGDGRMGFAARMLAGERMVVDRLALAGGRHWSARFNANPPVGLVCGLLDGSGQIARQADCSSGFVQLDDTPAPAFEAGVAAPPPARGGFFIQSPTDAAVTEIDDLRIVSDAAPDTDGDLVPDAADACPRGLLPADGDLQVLIPDVTVSVCVPDPTTVVVPVPQLVNACEKATLSGRLSAVNGTLLDRSVAAVSATGKVLLPIGTHQISWEVQDGSSKIYATLTRTVTVIENVGPQCCGPDRTPITGSAAGDVTIRDGARASCVLANSGGDIVVTGGASDWNSGGPGADYIDGGGGDDVLVGGAGDDYLTGGTHGALIVHAGPGNDTVHARFAASARIFGGPGADTLIGSDGPDDIYPGPGAAVVFGGDGDDTVTIYDTCELSGGISLHGGSGNDLLVSPVPLAQLIAAGVRVDGFERIVVDATRAYLSECFR